MPRALHDGLQVHQQVITSRYPLLVITKNNHRYSHMTWMTRLEHDRDLAIHSLIKLF